jgi:nitrate/TMAO reductase-like tetraheme cytochrome c subunit
MNQAFAESGKQPNSGYTKWKAECSSCHVAYPPKMLSGENWQQLMGGLQKHFDTNAELAAKDAKAILEFLERNSGSGDLYASASLRISDTPWFKREHRVISANEWALPEVKSRSNCSACHGKVVLGD